MCIKLKILLEIILITRFFKSYIKRREFSLRRIFAQHSIAMSKQCCNHFKPCRNNVAMLCCAKNRCCG